MERRSRKYTSCIAEMEATEEILREKWQKIQSSGPSRSKSGIEKLFMKLKERQSVTSAAFQALDNYDRLKGERWEFRERKETVLSAFDDWLKHVEAESVVGIENEADDEEREVLQKYSEFRKLSRTFARKWTDFRRSDKKVIKELTGLNASLSSFPGTLNTMEHQRIANFKWPNSQCQKLSVAVELAFDQMEFMTQLMNQIDDKLETLEVFFKLNKNSIALESRDEEEDDEVEFSDVEESEPEMEQE